MNIIARRVGWLSREHQGCGIGLRNQMALLGISGVLVTGAICTVALNYASLVQSEANGSNQFKANVASLSQSFLESRQIASDFLRKPGEMAIKLYAENHERQLADLSRSKHLWRLCLTITR